MEKTGKRQPPSDALFSRGDVRDCPTLPAGGPVRNATSEAPCGVVINAASRPIAGGKAKTRIATQVFIQISSRRTKVWTAAEKGARLHPFDTSQKIHFVLELSQSGMGTEIYGPTGRWFGERVARSLTRTAAYAWWSDEFDARRRKKMYHINSSIYSKRDKAKIVFASAGRGTACTRTQAGRPRRITDAQRTDEFAGFAVRLQLRPASDRLKDRRHRPFFPFSTEYSP